MDDKTRAERQAEREAELERNFKGSALWRNAFAERLGVRPEDLTEEQLTASDLEAAAQPERFPSTPDVRRRILKDIAAGNEKYARPFDRGKVARASLIGTESWSDYGAVVLQMAILDTLLSIEERLTALTQPPT